MKIGSKKRFRFVSLLVILLVAQSVVPLSHRYMPRDRFVDVSAEKFVEHPERYGSEGEWIDREVES